MSQDQFALSVGTVLHGRFSYRIERVLGAGGFGITYLASATVPFGNLSTQANVAVKELFRRSDCLRDASTGRVVTAGNEDSQSM